MDKELLFRNCSKCTHIEDCPEPVVNPDGSNDTPNFCPKKEEIIMTPKLLYPVE